MWPTCKTTSQNDPIPHPPRLADTSRSDAADKETFLFLGPRDEEVLPGLTSSPVSNTEPEPAATFLPAGSNCSVSQGCEIWVRAWKTHGFGAYGNILNYSARKATKQRSWPQNVSGVCSGRETQRDAVVPRGLFLGAWPRLLQKINMRLNLSEFKTQDPAPVDTDV